MFGLGIPIVAATFAVLLGLFAVAISINLVRGRDIDCGCFSTVTPSKITYWHVVRNLALASGAVIVAMEWPRDIAIDTGGGRLSTSNAIGSVIAAYAGLVLFMLAGAAVRLGLAAKRFVDLESEGAA